MASVTRNTTYGRLRFHSFANGVIDAIEPGLHPFKSGILGLEYTKTLAERASGQFQVRLKRNAPNGTSWLELLDEGDWWEYEIVKNDQAYSIAYGQIDHINIEIGAGGAGEDRVRVSVWGSDAARPLDIQPVYFNPYDPFMDNAAGIKMATILGDAGGKPSVMLVNMLRGLMGANGVFGGFIEVPKTISPPVVTLRAGGAIASSQNEGSANGSRWLDMLDTERFVEQDLRGLLVVGSAEIIAPEQSGSVWGYLQSWANPVLNEMFCECSVGPFRNVFFRLREKPFENAIDLRDSPWFQMEPWDLRNVRSLSLSKGRNRKNYIQLVGDPFPAMTQDMVALMQPSVDQTSVKRHGLRRMEERTRYYDNVGIGNRPEFQSWVSLVIGWNALNHKHLNGVVSLGEARPEIRVGQRVMFKDAIASTGVDPGTDFYVEAVRHSLNFGAEPGPTTELQLSRGYPETRRLTDLVKAVNGYSESLASAVRDQLGSSNRLRAYELSESEIANIKGKADKNTTEAP